MQQQKTYFVDTELCLKCKECRASEVCPRGVLVREDPSYPPYVEPGCSGCGKCVTACKGKALKKKITAVINRR